jgi:hypothetical protein
VRTKDLASLLSLLQLSGQSGMLFLRLPEENDDKVWVAQCQLENGIVTMCRVITTSDGRVAMSNEAALQWLMRLGTLQWRLDEKQIPPANAISQPTAQSETSTPQSFGQAPLQWSPVFTLRDGLHIENSPASFSASQSIPMRAVHTWRATESGVAAREQRQVWLLVDGQRSIEEIAQLLHKPLSVVMKILADLKLGGFIY